jgi:hypothetical protein
MNGAYEDQVAVVPEQSETPAQVAGWYSDEIEQLGLSETWGELAAKFERQVAQKEKQQEAWRHRGQQREFDEIRRAYVFVEPSSIKAFLQEHRALPELLLDAIPWLKRSFGDSATIQLQLMAEEDEPSTLYALILWTDTLESAQEALSRFDETWWLSNCRRASGNLIVDYELR